LSIFIARNRSVSSRCTVRIRYFQQQFFSYESQSVQNEMQQCKGEFQQLGKDLPSGNLSAAQTDFTTLQQLAPQNSSTTSAASSSASSNPIPETSQVHSRTTPTFSKPSKAKPGRRQSIPTTITTAAADRARSASCSTSLGRSCSRAISRPRNSHTTRCYWISVRADSPRRRPRLRRVRAAASRSPLSHPECIQFEQQRAEYDVRAMQLWFARWE
jgi:hypothetical protein